MYRRSCSGQQKSRSSVSHPISLLEVPVLLPIQSTNREREKEKPIPRPPRSTEIERTPKPTTRTLCSPTSPIVLYDSFVFRVVLDATYFRRNLLSSIPSLFLISRKRPSLMIMIRRAGILWPLARCRRSVEAPARSVQTRRTPCR